jgi:hypothetical protein
LEVGKLVIEVILVEPDYPGISSLVIAMARFTFQGTCVFIPAVEPLLFTYILGNQGMVVAVKA